jgi:glycosyltransferase involved in cell wall biosynthesis
VFTSDYEGFGLVLLEAMSQGIPVIARRISAIPEVLGDSHPGLVDSGNSLDFARKICDVSDNCVKLNNYLEYQALQLKNFSIKRTQKAHELLYSRLLATKMQE